MTDEVAELVLENNRAQTLALVIARRQSLPMVNVHARYIDVLETEGWLDRGIEFLPTRQADRRAPGGGQRAAGARAGRAHRLHEERQRGGDGAHRPARGRPAGGRPRPVLPVRAAPALPRRHPPAPAAPGDHLDRRRQPDGQPVGHLVRPPDDRGHRRIRGRRHEGVARGPRGVRLRRAVGRDRGAHRRRPARHPARPVPRLPADGRAGRRCGCSGTAARRSTSPPPWPSSSPGIAALARGLEPVLVGRMADVVRSGRGVAADRRRARGPRRAGRRVAAAAHRVRPRRGRRRPRARRRRRRPGRVGRVRPAGPDVAVGRHRRPAPLRPLADPGPLGACATTC